MSIANFRLQDKENAGHQNWRPAFCSRCAAKTELCVTVFFLWALVSFDPKVFTAYPTDDQLIHPRDLAVDLFNRASNKFECDESLLRKEVIQPQVPLRLPCYDFIPITIHTFGAF